MKPEFLRGMGLDEAEITIIMDDHCPNCDHEESGFDDSSPCCGALVFRGECQFCGSATTSLTAQLDHEEIATAMVNVLVGRYPQSTEGLRDSLIHAIYRVLEG